MESTTTLSEKKVLQNTDTQTMDSAVLIAPGKFEWQKTAVPEPKDCEVLIRLEGCGLCASNIPMWEGRDWFNYPIEAGSPGHEGYGIIEKTGAKVTGLFPGDRVAALSYRAFAEFDVAKADQVVKIPQTLSSIPFPGEPLGCAMNIFKRSDIRSGQTVAIVGAGFLGLLLVRLAQSAGARVIAVSRRPYSLEIARQLGAEIVFMDEHQKVIETVQQLTGGNWCERVIEATGKESALNLAAELTGVRSKLIVAGFHQDGFRNVNMQLWNWRGIDVINAHERDPAEYINGIHAAVDAIEKGVIRPQELFTHEFQKEEINDAFRALTERPEGFIKGILKF